MPHEWLTIREIARDELHCGTRPIYLAVKSGELKAVALNNRGDLRVHRDWVTAWLERRAASRKPVRTHRLTLGAK